MLIIIIVVIILLLFYQIAIDVNIGIRTTE